tara:strand:- start:2110 stop:2646 length:537 start_codon:yes stop_codon:yes gene_type:complete
MKKIFLVLFLVSNLMSGVVISADYSESSGFSSEKSSTTNGYAGRWSAQLPTSCKQWGISGEISFIISQNPGVEHIEGLIGKYRFIGNRQADVIVGTIDSQQLYALKIDLNHKYLKVYSLRNVHAEEGKSPCIIKLDKEILLKKKSIEERLKRVKLLEEQGLISTEEAATKRENILDDL